MGSESLVRMKVIEAQANQFRREAAALERGNDPRSTMERRLRNMHARTLRAAADRIVMCARDGRTNRGLD